MRVSSQSSLNAARRRRNIPSAGHDARKSGQFKLCERRKRLSRAQTGQRGQFIPLQRTRAKLRVNGARLRVTPRFASSPSSIRGTSACFGAVAGFAQALTPFIRRGAFCGGFAAFLSAL